MDYPFEYGPGASFSMYCGSRRDKCLHLCLKVFAYGVVENCPSDNGLSRISCDVAIYQVHQGYPLVWQFGSLRLSWDFTLADDRISLL